MTTGEEHYPPPRHRRPLSEPPSLEGDTSDDGGADTTFSPESYSPWFEEQFGSQENQEAVPEAGFVPDAAPHSTDQVPAIDYDPNLAFPGQTRLPGLESDMAQPRMPGESGPHRPQQPNPGGYTTGQHQLQQPDPGGYTTGEHQPAPQQFDQPAYLDPNTAGQNQFAQPGYDPRFSTGRQYAQPQYGQPGYQAPPQGMAGQAAPPAGQYQAMPQPTQYQNGPLDSLRKGPLPLIGAVVALLAAAGLIGWMFSGSGGEQEVTIGGSEGEGSQEEATEEAADLPPLSPEALPPADEDGLVGLELALLDPYTGTGATGTVELYFNAITGRICHTFDVASLTGRYQAYVHEAVFPREGPIVVDLGEVANGVARCVNASPIDVTRALAESAGFYVAAHGPDRNVVLRSQLADATMAFDNRDPELLASQEAARQAAEEAGGDDLFGVADEGAYLVVDAGQVTFEGAVPDQATADRLRSAFIALSGMGVEVIDNLQIQAGAPPPSGRVIVADALLFGTGEDRISGDSPVIDTLADLMIVNPGWTMTITGHTDNVGDYLLNIELSLRRANNVRDRLDELGVPAERIRVQGAGPEQPIESNDTSEGRAKNRRIEVSIDS